MKDALILIGAVVILILLLRKSGKTVTAQQLTGTGTPSTGGTVDLPGHGTTAFNPSSSIDLNGLT